PEEAAGREQGTKGVFLAMTVRVGIVGGTGYAGGELMRILSQHPEAQVVYAASRTQAGQPVAATHPGLSGIIDLEYEPIDAAVMAERCDVVFLAVPHGASLPLAAELLPTGVRVIDIGSDFRFRDPAEYERWYGREHGRPELLKDAVYGLPELHREELRTARLVANPGCYPTSVILAIAPFVAAGAVETRSVTVASMSGVSGAGSTPGPMYHLPEATGHVRAYRVPGHRHAGEMEQGIRTLLERRAGDDPLAGNLLRDLRVSVVPHLVPM